MSKTYKIMPYNWFYPKLYENKNTQTLIPYIFFDTLEFFINQTFPKTFSIRTLDAEKTPWIYKDIPYSEEEEKHILQKKEEQWEEYKKFYEEIGVNISEEGKENIQKKILTELFFWDIIIPTLKKENLPHWKKSFDEFSQEDKNIFYTLNQKIVCFQDTLNKFSNLIKHDIVLNFTKNEKKSKIEISEEENDKILIHFDNIKKLFPDIITNYVTAYELSIDGLPRIKQKNFFFKQCGNSKIEMTAHEKITFKKHLKDLGINI